MNKKKKIPVEDLIVPPQDQRICGTKCVCQITLVLSSVALVCLTVAIFMLSNRTFQSRIDEKPVMCTTTRNARPDSADWCSCGEWGFSKTSGGGCNQIYVNLRNNGTNLTFQNCTNSGKKTCEAIDQDLIDKARCMMDECKNLTGTFNCTEGQCLNITDSFECVFQNTGESLKCSGRHGKITCMDINGLFSCSHGTCTKFRTPYNCDRRCVDLPTRNKNIIILSGDKIYLSQCQNAINTDTQEEVWNESADNIVMVSCFLIKNALEHIEAVDCINGTVLDQNMLQDLANFTYLKYIHVAMGISVPEIAPTDLDLTISTESRLMINLKGSVNTIMDECSYFLKEYGRDGADYNANARFPCFYAPSNKNIVVTRFELDLTYKQFLVAFVIPSTFFVISCLVLFLCQRDGDEMENVGDDAKMRFKDCADTDTILASKNYIANSKRDATGADGEDMAMVL